MKCWYHWQYNLCGHSILASRSHMLLILVIHWSITQWMKLYTQNYTRYKITELWNVSHAYCPSPHYINVISDQQKFIWTTSSWSMNNNTIPRFWPPGPAQGINHGVSHAMQAKIWMHSDDRPNSSVHKVTKRTRLYDTQIDLQHYSASILWNDIQTI